MIHNLLKSNLSPFYFPAFLLELRVFLLELPAHHFEWATFSFKFHSSERMPPLNSMRKQLNLTISKRNHGKSSQYRDQKWGIYFYNLTAVCRQKSNSRNHLCFERSFASFDDVDFQWQILVICLDCLFSSVQPLMSTLSLRNIRKCIELARTVLDHSELLYLDHAD